MNQKTFPIRYFLPSIPMEPLQIVFPGGLQVGVRANFVREEPQGLRSLTMIWPFVSWDDVSIFLDILTLECWAPLERPPFWLGCKQTLRRWLVLHNQVVSQRRPLLLLPPLCEADDPCSVNTACAPESSFHNVTSEHDSSFVFFDALVLTPQSWGDRSPSM